MHFDFAAFLVLATFLTGAIWLYDVLVSKKARLAANRDKTPDQLGYMREPIITEYARSFFPVILLVLVLRSFLYEPFKIPSGSMMPTLLAGDFILVNKFAYGIRLPVVEYEVWSVGDPQRGDAVVFRYPNDPSLDYIKRVVGLPGDEISYFNKTLTINGQEIPKQPRGEYAGYDHELLTPVINVHEETLGKHTFNTLEQPAKLGLEGITRVPDGHYFVMGDNRDNSNDSRYWGFVPQDNLVGRAEYVWMSWDSGDGWFRWDRIGNSIN
jgi:signal peptidase I